MRDHRNFSDAERLQSVDVDRMATKLSRDFARHVARKALGRDASLPNQAAFRGRLREALERGLNDARAES